MDAASIFADAGAAGTAFLAVISIGHRVLSVRDEIHELRQSFERFCNRIEEISREEAVQNDRLRRIERRLQLH